MMQTNPFKTKSLVAIVYATALIFSLFVSEFLKAAVTGYLGPKTHFIVTAIICPGVFLLLGLLGSKRNLVIHICLLLLLSLWLWMTYPQNAPMNLTRQIAVMLPTGLVVLYMVGAIVTMARGEDPGKRLLEFLPLARKRSELP